MSSHRTSAEGAFFEEAVQLARVRQFLGTLLFLSVPFAVVYLVGLVWLRSRTLLAAFALLILLDIGGGLAWRDCARGQLTRAVSTVGVALLLVSLLGAVLLPMGYAVLMLVPPLAVAGVIPYLRGRALRLFTLASFATCAVVVGCGLYLPDRSDVPPGVQRAFILLMALGCSYLLLLFLWQFSARLRATLEQVLDRNAELRASHERFRSLATATTQIIWTTDARGDAVEDSPSWRAFTGQPLEEMLGWGWLDALHPDDRERVRETWQAVLARQSLYRTEYRLRRADGGYATVMASGAPVRNPDGSILEWVGANTDVTDKRQAETALRESEERARAIITALAEGIVMLDAEGLIRLANASAERLLGMTFADLDGLSFRDPRWCAVYEDGMPMSGDEFPAIVALRTGTPQSNHVVGVQRQDGERVWLSINAQPLFAPEGRPFAVVASFFDITGRKQAEEERSQLLERERKARADAEAANRLKDEFLATVSHELRTPLTAILGWSKILSSRKLPPERHAHALEVIERNAQAQRALVEDLLDVSRIITGKLLLDIQRVDLAEVVERAIEAVRPAALAKEMRLERVVEPAQGELMGDPNRLQQVVWNLLSNAIKFTPRGGTVTVRLGQANAYRVLEVRDNGQGISADFLPYLFERFRQADSSATRVHGGLGLGLAIVRHVVELHGGRVRAESKGPGCGARFVVELPLIAAVPAVCLDERRASAREALPAPDLSGVRVLVVDDKADAREMLAASLQQYGANVLAAASAAEALDSMQRFSPGVLVSDIGMPDEDGYALLRRVRTLGKDMGGDIPAVALTGFAGPEERRRALSAGFQSHVPKPVDPLELAMVVANLARRA